MNIKEELRKAYQAGVDSVKFNKDRDNLLEEGTKQCPAEANFEDWFIWRYEEEKSEITKR